MIIRNTKIFKPDINYFNKEGICPLFKAVALNEPCLLKALVEIPYLEIDLLNMFRLTPLFYAITSTQNLEIIQILMKAGADPVIGAAFTMRGIVTDIASPMVQAVTKGRTGVLQIFYEFGYSPKRRWFTNRVSESLSWQAAMLISKHVPTLKSLARRTIKTTLSKITKIPTRKDIERLEIPKTLINYISFQ